jgi:hypothetical protein
MQLDGWHIHSSSVSFPQMLSLAHLVQTETAVSRALYIDFNRTAPNPTICHPEILLLTKPALMTSVVRQLELSNRFQIEQRRRTLFLVFMPPFRLRVSYKDRKLLWVLKAVDKVIF